MINPSNTRYELDVTIGGEKIEQVENFRYLGIDLDAKLSYKNHVTRIATKCKQQIGALCRTICK
jgi:hypothetical protein